MTDKKIELEVTYTNLEYPDKKEFAVKGVGMLKNGEPHGMTKEEVDEFKRMTGRTVFQAFNHRGDFTVRNVLAGGDK